MKTYRHRRSGKTITRHDGQPAPAASVWVEVTAEVVEPLEGAFLVPVKAPAKAARKAAKKTARPPAVEAAAPAAVPATPAPEPEPPAPPRHAQAADDAPPSVLPPELGGGE